jgi:hypothetical protein
MIAPATSPGVPAMRMSRSRYTLKRMMVAVAVVALAIAAVRWERSMEALSAEYSRHALAHRAKVADDHLAMLRPSSDPRAAELFERREAYRRAMAEKWNRAALFPWLPVEPDPPRPK